eukprot:m.74110 g.74110  ORF g.74110 m.74110 type:complete len:73 (-) comp16147_c0_seq3:801-1019(-)
MAQSLNHPDPHEAFLLSDLKEKKITYEKDAKTLNAATFTVNKEDHTLGNMLVQYVCSSRHHYMFLPLNWFFL